MKFSFKISLLLLYFISGINSLCQIQKLGIPEITYFNRRVYNGATQNWDITQSKSGFMYFANNNGVLEYDGGWEIMNC